MTRTTILIEGVTIEFPRARVTLGTIERSIARMFGIGARHDPTFTALSDVSVEIAEGEVVGLVGRNGAGKSTLLRVMAGIYRPDRGTAKAAGRISLLAGLGVGFNVNLSGRENVHLYGSILGNSRSVMGGLMQSIIEFAELEEFIDQPLRTYSAGMRARLGFSIASAIQPDILLIDEVLGVGDEDFKKRSTERLQEMVGGAGTVVIASHSVSLMKQVCTRCIWVEKGHIKMSGAPDEVIDAYLGGAAPKARAAR